MPTGTWVDRLTEDYPSTTEFVRAVYAAPGDEGRVAVVGMVAMAVVILSVYLIEKDW